MLKLSDAGLAVVTAVTGRLPLRLRSASCWSWPLRLPAAESRASVSPARRAERRQLVERLRALRAEARDCPDGPTKAAMAQAREALRLFDRGDEKPE